MQIWVKQFKGLKIRIINLALINVVVTIILMMAISIFGSLVSDTFFVKELRDNKARILANWELDQWSVCGTLIAFSAEHEEIEVLKKAFVVPFPRSNTGSPCTSLENLTSDDSNEINMQGTYPRYWFGSSSLIRIFTFLVGLAGTRVLLLALLLLIFSFYMITISRLYGWLIPVVAIFPTIVGTDILIKIQGFHLVLPFLFSFLFGCAVTLCASSKKALVLVLISGMWVNFVDVLTTPPLYMMIVIFPLILKCLNLQINHRQKFLLAFGGVSAWNFGYALAWITKWIVAILFSDFRSVYDSVIQQAKFRLSGSWENITPSVYNANKANLMLLLSQPLLVITIPVIVMSLLYSAIIAFRKLKLRLFFLILPALIVSLVTPLWYGVFQNHSMIHNWMTYMNISASSGFMLAVMIYLAFRKDLELY